MGDFLKLRLADFSDQSLHNFTNMPNLRHWLRQPVLATAGVALLTPAALQAFRVQYGSLFDQLVQCKIIAWTAQL